MDVQIFNGLRKVLIIHQECSELEFLSHFITVKKKCLSTPIYFLFLENKTEGKDLFDLRLPYANFLSVN